MYGNADYKKYLDKYYIGKRDHSIDRYWNVNKMGLGYIGSYLLLREVIIKLIYSYQFETFMLDALLCSYLCQSFMNQAEVCTD